MSPNCKCIKVATDGTITQITEQEQEKETKGRTQSAYALPVPQFWKHERTFVLSVVMNDMFTDEDCVNIPATMIWSHLRHEGAKPTEPIYGDFYMYNENSEDIIDFTMDDFVYILSKMEKSVADALCDCIR